MNSKRYSPTQVRRSLLKCGRAPEVIDTYLDATVRDQGTDNWLRASEAMLRAYPDTEERMKAWDKHDEWFVVEREDHIRHYGKEMTGFVLDCDGDIALQRIMGIVLAKYSFGHCHEQWTVLVSYDSEQEEWSGFGYDDEPQYRVEIWDVTLAEQNEDPLS